ncbi:MAG: AarF/ABC1/UbiB kinase family protein, partial [Candidatus Peribacteraceae bacterium]|nr:AarF/ABC1/UbiB kinase family protein [Candidatus Peribacteraceae bacterium]
GFFHADPHPANLLVLAPSTIVMLDVGMIGYLDDKTITCLLKLLKATIDKNVEQVLLNLESLGIFVKEFDRSLLCQDLEEMLDRYLGVPLKNLEVKEISQNILEVMMQHNLALPANLVLMIKAISTVEVTGRRLHPDFDIVSTAESFVKKLLKKKLSSRELLKRSVMTLQEGIELVEQLPKDLIGILRKFQEGKLKLNFEHRGLETLAREIDRASSRTSFSLVIAALIIGSSLVLQQQIGPFIFGYPILGIIGYLLASFIGFVLLISILRSWK